jgi:hypothetical protein
LYPRAKCCRDDLSDACAALTTKTPDILTFGGLITTILTVVMYVLLSVPEVCLADDAFGLEQMLRIVG